MITECTIRLIMITILFLGALPTAAQDDDIELYEDSFFVYNDYWFVILDKDKKTAAYYGAGEWEGLCFKSNMGKFDMYDPFPYINPMYYYNRLELATVGFDTYGIDLFIQEPPLKIMGEANGYTITEIYPYAFANSSFPEVPWSEHAFYHRSGGRKTCFYELVIPENIRIIGKKAFTGKRTTGKIDIGKDVTYIDSQALPVPEDGIIISRSMVPPTVNEDNFTESYINNAWLYVPAEAIHSYMEHETWGKFQHIYAIEGIRHSR